MSHTAYLAGPIDQDPQHGESPAKDLLDELLRQHEFAVFRPERAWSAVGVHPGSGLQNTNLAVIRTVDLVVVYLPAGVPTIGTISEMEFAQCHRKPVILYTNITGSWSLEHSVANRPLTARFPMTPEGRSALAEHLEIVKDAFL